MPRTLFDLVQNNENLTGTRIAQDATRGEYVITSAKYQPTEEKWFICTNRGSFTANQTRLAQFTVIEEG